MKHPSQPPPVSFCALTYGDNLHLARRCLESIRRFCDRSLYRLIVGANAVGAETEAYLNALHRAGQVDHLIVSRRNINKNPMMRRLIAHVETEFIWWFDDDSYFTQPATLSRILRAARRSPPTTVMWGVEYSCDQPSTSARMPDLVEFVRSATWYGGLTPPCWQPGGKGEFDFRGRGMGDGRWLFLTGGCWLARTSALRALDWPDRRLVMLNDDILLGEALRQQGWRYHPIEPTGLVINGAPRR
jgi:GT2 family glycosyltransferase